MIDIDEQEAFYIRKFISNNPTYYQMNLDVVKEKFKRFFGNADLRVAFYRKLWRRFLKIYNSKRRRMK